MLTLLESCIRIGLVRPCPVCLSCRCSQLHELLPHNNICGAGATNGQQHVAVQAWRQHSLFSAALMQQAHESEAVAALFSSSAKSPSGTSLYSVEAMAAFTRLARSRTCFERCISAQHTGCLPRQSSMRVHLICRGCCRAAELSACLERMLAVGPQHHP